MEPWSRGAVELPQPMRCQALFSVCKPADLWALSANTMPTFHSPRYAWAFGVGCHQRA